MADQEAEEEVQADVDEPNENKEFAEQDVKSEDQSAADNEEENVEDEICLLTTKG